MKKITLLFLTTLFVLGCASNPLRNINTDKFSFKGTDVYYDGKLMATMANIEVAYDDGKIVREVTYRLVSDEFNEQVFGLIKYFRLRHPSYEIEVDIPYKGL
jgi:hypothetical protein